MFMGAFSGAARVCENALSQKNKKNKCAKYVAQSKFCLRRVR